MPLHDVLSIEYINDLALRPLQPNVIYAGTKYNGMAISYRLWPELVFCKWRVESIRGC